jgi:hypothetical protein
VRVSSNGNKAFFNQVVAAFTGWVDKRNVYGKAVVFGDDMSALPTDTVEALAKFMDENKCAYKWSNGQFAIVDNTVAYHSRQPFTGRRRVFACIGLGEKEVDSSNEKHPTHNQTQLVLTSGDKMPSVGLGCWKIPKEQTAEVVYNAIANPKGYRLIDEACDYGNEKEAG